MAGLTRRERELAALLRDLDFQRSLLKAAENDPDGEQAILMVSQIIESHEARIDALLGDDPSEDATGDFQLPKSLEPKEQQTSLSPEVDYWPSANPSPFIVSAADGGNGQSVPLIGQVPLAGSSSDPSRKRTREGSMEGSPNHPSKKAASANPMNHRHQDLDALLKERLEANRQMFAAMRAPAEIAKGAKQEGLSEADYLDELAGDEKENEKSIRLNIQMEKDQDLARLLQYHDHELHELHDSPVELPYRSQPCPSTPSTQPDRQQHTTPSLPGQAIHLVDESDDDIQEIPRSTNSDSDVPADKSDESSSHEWRWEELPSDPIVDKLEDQKRQEDRDMRDWSRQHRHTPMDRRPPPPVRKAGEQLREYLLQKTQKGLGGTTETGQVDVEEFDHHKFPKDIRRLLEGIKDINNALQADDDETPADLQVTLMKHQRIGLKWLKAKEASSHRGGILADEMGLGKTIQAIALMLAHPPSKPNHPTLIVAPKALLSQWKSEIGRHTKPGRSQLSVFTFHGLPDIAKNPPPWRDLQEYDVVLTTFATLASNFKNFEEANKCEDNKKDQAIVRKWRKCAVLFGDARWGRVIIDEAQNIKNPKSKSAKACCALNAKYRWCLTGTPMMNRLEDFQSLLQFLRIRPYNDAKQFKNHFSDRLHWPEAMMQFRVLIKAVLLRRTKQTIIDGKPILELPPKVIEKVHVVFSPEEKEFYSKLEENSQKTVDRLLKAGNVGKHYSHIFVLLLRLRQACDHPLLINGLSSDAVSSDSTTSAAGIDLVANAKLLSTSAVSRLKGEDGIAGGTCPICMDIVENPVIYIPCGHFTCAECFARLTERDEENDLKCQNCRGPVNPSKITDAGSFIKVHDPSSLTSAGDSDKAEPDLFSDSESESDDGETPKKKKSLADLRTKAMRNKAHKRRYFRRLEKMWTPSAKINKAMEILEQNEERGKGEKTIIFSLFTSVLDLLEIPMNRRGWKYTRFDGASDVTSRTAAIEAFTNDPTRNVMLVSLKAGNAGLNLVAASHIILFDPFWNPYVEDQAVDRAHRIGQKNEVFVHRLLIEGTVEDRVVALQEDKRTLISGALDEGGSLNVAGLSTKELVGLFGVRQR